MGSILRRLGDVGSSLAFVVALLAGLVVIVDVSQRGPLTGAVARTSDPSVGADADGDSQGVVQASPSPALDIPAPSAGPIESPAGSSGPTPRPTRTPKPVADPRAEGTPQVHLASGHLGDTIVNDEITVRVDPATIPASFDMAICTGGDHPELTQAMAFTITESWRRWQTVEWALELGSGPQFNWMEDVPDYRNGHSTVVVMCHEPGTSTTVYVFSGPQEHTDVPEDYRWTIR